MTRDSADTDVPTGKRISRALLGAFWIGAGVNHFVSPRFYEAIVPPSLKKHSRLVVQASGVAEVAGGAAVFIPGAQAPGRPVADRRAARGVPGQHLHGPRARALQVDPAVGALRAAAAAAAGDAVGMAGHPAMKRIVRERASDAAMFGSEAL